MGVRTIRDNSDMWLHNHKHKYNIVEIGISHRGNDALDKNNFYKNVYSKSYYKNNNSKDSMIVRNYNYDIYVLSNHDNEEPTIRFNSTKVTNKCASFRIVNNPLLKIII